MTSFSARLGLGYEGLVARLTSSVPQVDFLACSQLSDHILGKLVFYQTYMCFSEENDCQLNKNYHVINFQRKKKFPSIHSCHQKILIILILDKNCPKI